MSESQEKLKEYVKVGYEHFWTRTDRPWRNKIYEANILAAEIKNLNKSEIRERISRPKEDLLEQEPILRDMRV